MAKVSAKKPPAKGRPKPAAAKTVNKKTTKSKPAPTAPPPAVKKSAAPVGKLNSKKVPTPASKIDMVAVKSSKKSIKSKERDPERKGIIVPAPVPTDAKPMKNRLGMKSSEMEHYRDLLLAKRRELLGDMSSMEHEALNRGGNSNLSNLPMHMADMGTDNYEQEFTLGLMEKDRNLLREINSALAKLQDGSYGICEGTGLPISKARLEAQPWAKFSIEHARKLEQRGVR